ncbi:sensor histidine kinase [Streptomyces triticiradicis]|uniref:Sensor histidine kinase n=1 Tax=Streptomyces triticiradicis TaxID=2651189 RepID=A0A7J5DQ17_9ACTN|nr:sensor histidine kinase [Streptomyces triticiradicis]
MGLGAVTRAREAMAGYLADAGVTVGSAFADAVLLAVSELVTNVLRHATRSPVTNVGITVGAGHLVVSVADTEPRLPPPAGMGVGLLMVTEPATAFGGTVSMETAAGHDGKTVLVRFPMPS